VRKARARWERVREQGDGVGELLVEGAETATDAPADVDAREEVPEDRADKARERVAPETEHTAQAEGRADSGVVILRDSQLEVRAREIALDLRGELLVSGVAGQCRERVDEIPPSARALLLLTGLDLGRRRLTAGVAGHALFHRRP